MTAAKVSYILPAVVALALIGCDAAPKTVGATPPAPVAVADEMLLRASSPAVNWDDDPGPDGLMVRVDLFRHPGALPVMVKGTLEFILYEGVVASGALSRAKPFRTWRFAGKELEPFRSRSMVGWGYVIRLAWGQQRPGTSSVTLWARYLSPGGQAISDEPVTINTGLR